MLRVEAPCSRLPSTAPRRARRLAQALRASMEEVGKATRREVAGDAFRRALSAANLGRSWALADEPARAARLLARARELMARAEILSRRTLADKPDELAAVLWLVANHRIETLGFVQAKGLLSEAAAMAREPGLQAAIRCAESEALAQGGQLDEGIASLQAHAEREAGVLLGV